MAARHRENNQRPEARASGCCGHLRPRHYLRLSFGIAALVVAIFAAGALGAPAWAEGSVKFFDGTVDVTARANLWRIHIKRSGAFDDDDDNRLRRGDLDARETWRSVRLNRAAAIAGFAYSVIAFVWYVATFACRIPPAVDVAVGALGLVLALLAFVGAGTWGTTMEKHELDDIDGEEWDDAVPCAAGCALEAFTGCLYLGFGATVLSVGLIEFDYVREKKRTSHAAGHDDDEEEPPVVGAVVASAASREGVVKTNVPPTAPAEVELAMET